MAKRKKKNREAEEQTISVAERGAPPREPLSKGKFFFCVLAAVVLPAFLFLLLTSYSLPQRRGESFFAAMAGCSVFGVGVLGLMSPQWGRPFKRWVAPACFLSGLLAAGICSAVMYASRDGMKGWTTSTTYYFSTLLFLCLPLLYYAIFRGSIFSLLRSQGISKTRIRKLKKGKKNFWWYEAIHREIGLGIAYPLNKAITILYPVVFGIAVFFGWFRFAAPLICVLHGGVALLTSVIGFYAEIQDLLSSYGTVFVLFRRGTLYNGKGGSIDSIFNPFLSAVFPYFFVYIHIIVMKDFL